MRRLMMKMCVGGPLQRFFRTPSSVIDNCCLPLFTSSWKAIKINVTLFLVQHLLLDTFLGYSYAMSVL